MENNEFSKEVMSRNIRKYLGFNKMTATELAEKLNVSKASVSGWVNGNYYPRINYIEGMAKIFGCNKSDLIECYTEDMAAKVDYSVSVNNDLSFEETMLIELYRKETDHKRDMVKRLLNYDETMKKLIGGVNNELIQSIKEQIPNKRNE